MSYYAVKVGRNIGIYRNWKDCKKQVLGYPNARYKKFKTFQEAKNYIFEEANEIIYEDISDYKIKKPSKKKIKDKQKFFEDKEIAQLRDNEAVAYVDGSFDLETFTYSYGVVYFTNKDKQTFNGRKDDEDMAKMRNVSGELEGAKVAMKIAKGDKDVLYLHYDYEGIEEWALGNWKANKEGVKNYQKFYNSIKNDLDVRFIKVPAHAGIKYNEEADQLAKDAIL